MPRTVKKPMYKWDFRMRRRRPQAWNVVSFEIMWVVWREKNRRAFEGLRMIMFVRSSLLSLVSLLVYP